MDVDDAQRQVAEFVQDHDLETPPEFRLLDLVSEVGELAKDANTSTDYGDAPADLDLAPDEVGDALFALLALADALEIDAEEALAEALEKYDGRMATDAGASPGSGE